MSRISDIAKILVEKNGLKQSDADIFAKMMFEVVAEGLKNDKQVKIKGLGTFKILKTKDRESINVNTGERIVIEGREKITFTPDTIIKEIVNRPFAQFETVEVNDGVDFNVIDEKYDTDTTEEDTDVEEDSVFDSEVTDEGGDVNPSDQILDTVKETPQDEVKEVEDNEELVEETPVVEESREDTSEDDADEVISSIEEASDETINSENDAEDVILSEEVQNTESSSTDDLVPEDSASSEADELDEVIETPQKESFFSETSEVTREETLTAESDNKEENGSVVEEEDDEDEESEEPFYYEEDDSFSFTIKKYFAYIGVAVIVALIFGCIYFYSSYSKAESQLEQLKTENQHLKNSIATQQQRVIEKKAKEDADRMKAPADAIEQAEKAKEKEEATENVEEKAETKPEVAKTSKTAEQKVDNNPADAYAKYNTDARIRHGAYIIVGIDKTIKAKKGQTIKGLSKAYLGPGMECYLEALNGTSVTEGQTIKIPKLKVKKKK